jgi:glycosyltransferase involved in cell wall biosynthesis
MGKRPAISIIMPVYNAMPFLPQAVQSITAQTFTDWELLAIDDASTDGSWDYLQRLADPRIRIYRNETNRCVPFTINRGIDLAAGKWIARMDADDLVLVDRLAKQVAAMEANLAIDLLGTGSFLVDKELKLVGARRASPDHRLITRWPSLYFILTFGALLGKAQWWRRWRMDERIGISGHEFDLYFRSFRESTFSNVPEPLYVYRFVGHTRAWGKMTKSVYYKAMTLMRFGFRPGLICSTLFGLATLAPRPLLYAAKLAVGSQTGLLAAGGTTANPDDVKLLQQGLAEIYKVEVPLKAARS